MRDVDREQLQQNRAELEKTEMGKDLLKYHRLLKGRDIPKFNKAVTTADDLVNNLAEQPYELVKTGCKAFYDLLQHLNMFSQTVAELEAHVNKGK